MTGKLPSSALALLLFSCGPSAPEPTTPESSPESPNSEVDQPEDSSSAEPNESDASDGTEASGRTREKRATSDSPLAEIMAEHARDAEKIRAAVIEGRPEDSGPPADSILHLFQVEKLPEAWVKPAERMQASAERVKNSSDIAGVAAAIADVGTSCGWCHAKLGGPTASPMAIPENEGTLESRMKVHTWATERLWEGLYVPSSVAWKKGADALQGTEFPAEVIKKGGVYAKSSAKEFTRIAAKLPQQSTPTARAAVYAELLGTCGSCHLALRE